MTSFTFPVAISFCMCAPTVASYNKHSRVVNGGVHVKTHFESNAIPRAVYHTFVIAAQVVEPVFKAKHAYIQGIANN